MPPTIKELQDEYDELLSRRDAWMDERDAAEFNIACADDIIGELVAEADRLGYKLVRR